MTEPSTEALFVRYRETGDPQALAAVFDHLAPQLLLVAAHLAGGGLAEDLVQATFLDAIAQRQRWDASRPLAPWLVGLLGNHVREARRQRRRVPDPQRFAVRESERPDDVAEANECIEAVHAAVERLPLHYRQVLSLRLVHGLDQQQIASSLGVPLGTVKVRLHRGVAMLRRALPAGLASAVAVLLSPGRGLAAVREVVLGQGGVAAGAAAATAIGLLIGGWMMKQVVIAAAVVVLVIGAWFAVDAARATPVPVEVAGGAAAAPVATRDSALPAPAPQPAVAPPVPAQEASVSREAAPTTGSLAVQVTWADGTAACGIKVSTYSRDLERRAVAEGTPLRNLAQRTSDAGGKLRFDDLVPGVHRLLTSSAPAARSEATVVAGVVSQCTLAVVGDVRLRVSVVDEARQPQPGAAVWCYDANVYDGERERCLGRTDRAGEFVFRGLPLYSVWARQSGRQPSSTHDLWQGRPDDTPREEIVVQLVIGAAGCAVLGSVVDPQGQSVPAARVFVACDDEVTPVAKRMALLVTTDAAGKFACDEVPAGERSIVADAPGFAASIARITTSPTEPVTTTLALRTGATLSGRVTDDAGRPIAGVQVTAGARSVVWGIHQSWSSERTTKTDVEGRYRVEAICPGAIEARVRVEPEAVRQFQLEDGQQQTWDVTKEPGRYLAGIVLDAQDKPLAGWRVLPVGAMKPGRVPRQEDRTDAAGRFRFEGMEDIDHRVFVFAPVATGQDAWGAAGMVPRVVLNGIRPSPTELVVRIDAAAMASGWIEGSIAMPEGTQAKATLSLYAKVLSGGGFSVPQERLEPGVTTFRLGPLPAGEYDLLCDIEGRGRLAQRNLRLSPDETLRLPPFAADAQRPLQLLLRHADGHPATGADVKLRSGLDRCRETGPGRYESQPVEPGQYEAIVRGPDFALCTFAIDFTGQTEPFERTVPAGTAVQLCLKPTTPRDRWIGAMQVWIHDAQGVEVVRDMIQVDGKQDFVWPIGLLPGTYTVKVSVFGDGTATATLQVAATPLRVDLPLAK